MKIGRRLGAVLGLPLLVACGADHQGGAHEEEVASSSAPLILTGAKWPNGIVPVCWSQATTQRADFALRSRQVRHLAINSWPTVANVEFTGWGTCPANTAGMLKINLNDDAAGNSGVGFSSAGVTMNLGVLRGDFTGALVPHEFGHALGFHHEMVRSDFGDDPPPSGCSEGNIGGNTLNTAPDRQSIMASTGYCQNNPDLSIWDIVGARTAYGPRVNAAAPLITAYHPGRGDHGTVATSSGISNLNSANYAWSYAEGWVFANQIAGTVPLRLYFHSGRGDYFSTATTAGQNSAVEAGYSLVRTEGFVFSSAQTGTVPLKLYWHAGRQDNMLLTTAVAEAAALEVGYTFVRIEGHIPQSRPYSMVWTYWHGGRLDNLLTRQNSPLAGAAAEVSYEGPGFDGAIWNFAWPSTRPLKTFWHGSFQDHRAVATAQGEADAIAQGYASPGSVEGHVHVSSQPGSSPMRHYWHAGRGDSFTTIHNAGAATEVNYTLVRTEGWGIPMNP